MLHVAAPACVAQFGWMPAELTDAQVLGRALAYLREERGLSQPEAADRIGLGSGAAWGKYEQGKAPSIFNPATQRRLLGALHVSEEEWLLARNRVSSADGHPAEFPATPMAPGLSDISRRSFDPAPGMTAVFGMIAGNAERVAISPGSEIRYVPMHPAQRGYGRIGAVEVVGESMYPRWKPRELAYFVFDLPPPRGDDVVIEFIDGSAAIKEYLGRTPSHLLVKEWGPERTFDIPMKEIKALHAVVG